MDNPSLLPGRNSRPLTPEQKGKIERELRENLGYDGPIVWRDGPATKSCFAPGPDPTEPGKEVGILYIGSDILPGTDTLNPDSSLDRVAALAHEVTHCWRYDEGRAWEKSDLDEIATSLQAITLFWSELRPRHVKQLVEDALARLGEHYRKLRRSTRAHPRVPPGKRPASGRLPGLCSTSDGNGCVASEAIKPTVIQAAPYPGRVCA